MTNARFDSTVVAAVEESLDEVTDQMFANLGAHYMGLVELRVRQRTELDDGEEHRVHLRVVGLELVPRESSDDEELRQRMVELRRVRTSEGTLDEALREDPEGDAHRAAVRQIRP